MHDTLEDFRVVWESIIRTGIYNKEVENLALELTTFKDLDLRSQEDLQFFNFALIFARFIVVYKKVAKQPNK